jgi:hypothetical protein
MRRLPIVLTLLVVLLSAGATPAGAAAPDRKSLLQAWEEEQHADPRVSSFEDLGDGRYHLTTDRFPYDGVVVVNEVVVDDTNRDMPYGAVVGHVVVDLPDLDEGELARHATSIGLWRARNVLYWDPDSGGWITAAEWSRRAVEEAGGYPSRLGVISSGVWILFLVALVVALALLIRRANRQMKSAMAAQETVLAEQRRSMEMQEAGLGLVREQNQLLGEILAQLRQQEPPPDASSDAVRES